MTDAASTPLVNVQQPVEGTGGAGLRRGHDEPRGVGREDRLAIGDHGPVRLVASSSMNALVVSKLFVLVNDIETCPPDTVTLPLKVGGGTRIVSEPALLSAPPTVLVTPAV